MMLELLVATVYAGQYVGQETFCGGVYGDGIALPVETYGTDWQCNDLIYIRYATGETLMARAVDAGPFLHNCVMTADGCLPIRLDVPINLWQHGSDTSAILTYYQNISAQARAN